MLSSDDRKLIYLRLELLLDILKDPPKPLIFKKEFKTIVKENLIYELMKLTTR